MNFPFVNDNHSLINIKEKDKLHPLWVSGFCDAESCFSIIISIKSKDKWKITASFEINLHIKDIEILYKIKSYFNNVGNINVKKTRKLCVYRVTSLKDLNDNIIFHFTKYPLLSSKYSDFILWRKVVEKMVLKEHLNKKGLSLILKCYASINRGVSKKVSQFFPKIIPYKKVKTILPDKLNPYWVSGFIAGDGSFVLGLRKNKLESKSLGIYFNFSVTQHRKDYELIKLFILFFGCGNISTRTNEKTKNT
jgi:hypothetical protein